MILLLLTSLLAFWAPLSLSLGSGIWNQNSEAPLPLSNSRQNKKLNIKLNYTREPSLLLNAQEADEESEPDMAGITGRSSDSCFSAAMCQAASA